MVATKKPWKTHGMSKSRIYVCWTNMIQRCTNPKSSRWADYGGRGIKICDRWRRSFDAFFEDMQVGYSDDLTIERIDVNGHYEPENCRWATRSDQNRNKRRYYRRETKHIVEFRGRFQSLGAWAVELGIPYRTLYARVVTQKIHPLLAFYPQVRRTKRSKVPLHMSIEKMLELSLRCMAENRRVKWEDLQKCILPL